MSVTKFKRYDHIRPLFGRRSSNHFQIYNIKKASIRHVHTNEKVIDIEILEGNAIRWGSVYGKGRIIRVKTPSFRLYYNKEDKLNYPIF